MITAGNDCLRNRRYLSLWGITIHFTSLIQFCNSDYGKLSWNIDIDIALRGQTVGSSHH